jgi:hypothetical protein
MEILPADMDLGQCLLPAPDRERTMRIQNVQVRLNVDGVLTGCKAVSGIGIQGGNQPKSLGDCFWGFLERSGKPGRGLEQLVLLL